MRGGGFNKRGENTRMRVSDGPTDHYSKTVSSVMVGGTSDYRGDVKDMRALFYVLCFFFSLFWIGVIPLKIENYTKILGN